MLEYDKAQLTPQIGNFHYQVDHKRQHTLDKLSIEVDLGALMGSLKGVALLEIFFGFDLSSFGLSAKPLTLTETASKFVSLLYCLKMVPILITYFVDFPLLFCFLHHIDTLSPFLYSLYKCFLA